MAGANRRRGPCRGGKLVEAKRPFWRRLGQQVGAMAYRSEFVRCYHAGMSFRALRRRCLAPVLAAVLLPSEGAEARSVGDCSDDCGRRHPARTALLLNLGIFGGGTIGFWAWRWWPGYRERRAQQRSRREGDRLTAEIVEKRKTAGQSR
jgi:hypothetical protein